MRTTHTLLTNKTTPLTPLPLGGGWEEAPNNHEKQGILEDRDSGHRNSADGTDNYARSERLRHVAQANGELRIENEKALSLLSAFFITFLVKTKNYAYICER